MIPEKLISRNTLLLIAIVILVGVAAFGLGRLSATQSAQGELIIHEPGE